MAKEVTKRSDNYSQWYNDLALKADLAEQSAVRGCMVIKPYGYAIWEKMQATLDGMFKRTGVQNAYFPLFIPKSFFSREAEHVAGFAKECAVVTHHRLMNDPGGKGVVVDPEAKLEEELIVRPTSETIIWNTYKNWIHSWRDLPILCNQWCNVVRWEMRTRLFLRTAEFLWQEGHTAHATAAEAEAEKQRMVDVYARFARDIMALPVVVDPEAKLEEELIVRPTSETIIWSTYKNWITSWRDLPILCNQWCNVVRWEMRTRLFLRTAEFLWQEGHTAHATAEEAEAKAYEMVHVYADFARNVMALPVIVGHKSPNERFAGALDTLTIEAMMQDGKALQAGTSHFLGQNFAKSFDVQFTNKEGQQEYVWATSWGVSTRLMGALIMAHGDDNGLVLPPKLAPIQVVMVPIYKTDEERNAVLDKMAVLKRGLEALGHSVKIDDRDTVRPGFKFAEWELKGVPVRLAMGARDLAAGTVEVARRDTLTKETMALEGIEEHISKLLDDIQQNIYNKALAFREANVEKCDDWEEFKTKIQTGKFLLCHWDGTVETEQAIKDATKATIRCIPIDSYVCEEEGRDIFSGKPSKRRVVFAISY